MCVRACKCVCVRACMRVITVEWRHVLQCVAECCSVLQCVAVCCSVHSITPQWNGGKGKNSQKVISVAVSHKTFGSELTFEKFLPAARWSGDRESEATRFHATPDFLCNADVKVFPPLLPNVL